MTEFAKTTIVSVNCPACGCERVIKVGVRNGQQRYQCRGCDKKFRANGKAEGRRMDAELMGSAIRDFYTGKSYKQIAEGIEDEYNIPEPSKSTIYEWVRDFTDEAVDAMKEHKATTGGDWIADEMQVDVGGQKVWLWNVMDSSTRYILATHLTPRRDAQAARVVLRKAAEAADKPPKTITTDKLRSYLRAVKDALPEARHMQSEGFDADINNNLSERLQGTFRDRIKTLRGLDSIESGQRYLDGWGLNYNLFRDHHSLRNRTPGEVAKVEAPFTEWADVAKDGAASLPVLTVEARPPSRPPRKLPARQAVKLEPPKTGANGEDAEKYQIPPGAFRWMPRAMQPKAGRKSRPKAKPVVRSRAA